MKQAYLDIRLQTARGEAAGILSGAKLRQSERRGMVVVYREDLEKLREASREEESA